MARGESTKRGCGQRCGTAAGLAVLGLLCLGFGLVLLQTMPGLLRQQVAKNTRIDPKSAMFTLWKDLPVPFYISFYFMEVMNPKDILLGAKPVVSQRGPYVYREYRQKKNITFHSNNTVSFLSYRSFVFQPDRSNGSESDYIMMPNILVLGAAIILENMPFAMRVAFSSALALFHQNAFMNRTVGDIIWGYNEPFTQFLSSLGVSVGPGNEKFGLFSDLNNSNSGLFTVFTGMDDINKTHMVDSWNGLKEVSYWHSEECNMINGTPGELWPPFMTPSSPVELYSPDACRSIKLNYTQSGNFKGIPVYRYTAPKTLFANGTDYPPNEGFCPCRQSGIQNISSCKLNAPIFISQPHFLNADPALLDTVDGLHPNEKDHDLFVDIHPLTGIPMNCSVKIQLNLFIKHVSGIWQTGQIKPVVLPLIWFSESGEIVGDVLDDYYTHLITIPSLLEYLKFCLMGLGGLLLLAAGLVGLRTKTLNLSQQKDRSVAIQIPPRSDINYGYHGPLGKSFLFWRSNKNSGPRGAIPASRKKATLQWMEMK
ncbi:scavenger receptor class B member 1 isoform X2 [Thamnophis elegans]|uniref:scavenger receptor class B member 1 isoform X2 n=1 Tax=Thamnophis elegans TaxID=35005 RepID=UPI001376A7E7|nr:scavenger receptor class B member 1 isoform X2 [Thamnophis elegans]XP_032085047.1 scavenger receptor class B member 1 isoform X2 [Thamnophis elegans]